MWRIKFPSLPTLKFLSLLFLILPVLLLAHGLPSFGQATSRGGERGTQIPDWDGIWNTTYGDMELAQDTTSIFARYGTEGGRLMGTADGRSVFFDWYINEELAQVPSGTGEFTMNDDNASFKGWYMYSGGSEEYDWTGTRTGDRELVETRANVDVCFWTGSWETPSAVFIFDQVLGDHNVSGEFLRDGTQGFFDGVASGWTLEINWQTDIANGTAVFEMNDDLASFTGSFYPEDSDNESPWNGSFLSPDLRRNYAGIWETSWGPVEFFQDDATGVVNADFEDAAIGGFVGDCSLDGVVVGQRLEFQFSFATTDGDLSGSASVDMDLDGNTFMGSWEGSGADFTGGKISGTRR